MEDSYVVLLYAFHAPALAIPASQPLPAFTLSQQTRLSLSPPALVSSLILGLQLPALQHLTVVSVIAFFSVFISLSSCASCLHSFKYELDSKQSIPILFHLGMDP